MKTIIYLGFALALIVGLGFTGCKDDGKSLVEKACEWHLRCTDFFTTKEECIAGEESFREEYPGCQAELDAMGYCVIDTLCEEHVDEECATEWNAALDCGVVFPD
ncbi:hypothetical protein ACFL20_04065 [Spirochaetota bacterium]